VEQRYSPLALSGKLEEIASNMNLSLEQQAESFSGNRIGFVSSPLVSSSIFPTATMSSTLSGMDVSTSSSSSATTSISTGDTSIHFNAVVEAFITQWQRDRVRFHVYQLKAESLRNLIKIQQQKQPQQSQGQGMPYWQSPPQYPNFAQPSQQPQQQQPAQPLQQNKSGFAFKSLFGTWKT